MCLWMAGTLAGHDDSGKASALISAVFVVALFQASGARADDLVSGLSTDLIQITSNFTGTDIVLAFLLVAGGVVGVQMGVHVGSQMRGEWLRALLASFVLFVALMLLIGLVRTPGDIYSIVAGTP